MADNVTFEKTSFPSSVPEETSIRTTESTEVGDEGKQIQHVKLDIGDGTSTLPLPAGAATEAKQLADDHNVTVSNMIAAVETGLATSAQQTDGTQQAKINETAPTDATKNNAAISTTYTGDNLTTLTKVIGGVTYNKTLTYTGSRFDTASAWVAA